MCCRALGRKESDGTEWLNWTELSVVTAQRPKGMGRIGPVSLSPEFRQEKNLLPPNPKSREESEKSAVHPKLIQSFLYVWKADIYMWVVFISLMRLLLVSVLRQKVKQVNLTPLLSRHSNCQDISWVKRVSFWFRTLGIDYKLKEKTERKVSPSLSLTSSFTVVLGEETTNQTVECLRT